MTMNSHKDWHDRGYLPHFDAGSVVQVVTFRLADSLPQALLDRISTEKDSERGKRLESLIDEGRGSCLLREPANAAIVRDALMHFDGERYRLVAWVVMPNHVHAMIEQIAGHSLSGIVHSWKSYTAKAINRSRTSKGAVWAPDYFDRYVRNEDHYKNAILYLEKNPVKAGLAKRAEDWPFSSATPGSAGILPA